MYNMVRKKGPYKTAIMAVRVPPRFKQVLEHLAHNEGLDLSAWMRNLIIKELKSRGVIRDDSLSHIEGVLKTEGR